MIKSFKHKGLKRFFILNDKSLLNAKDCKRISYILDVLDSASCIEDINFPSFYLHKLIGNKKNFFSIRVTGNWRITFRMDGDHVYDIDLEDYH